ncbi:MAG: sigma-70 family RNA polymerase sigma factor [Acidobacteria bacterium]|nr:sigma-70 family RNA polymerase sigma factor [Acidobacteriota bacterium]
MLPVLPDPAQITLWLRQWRAGDKEALNHLLPAVYQELRRVAATHFRAERSEHTLQPTALLHEVYLRMVDQAMPDFRSRAHFFCVASQLMRQILVDHARAQRAEKRGGGQRVTLEDALQSGTPREVDLLALDEVLGRLATMDERKARALELQYFGGLTVDEIADAMDSSPRTTARELRLAKAYLLRELSTAR